MPTRILRPLYFLALFVATSAALGAHDFWIEPASFRPETDSILAVRLSVGDFGRGDDVPRDSARIVRFVALGPAGEKEIVGRDGGTPAGYVRLVSEGVHVLGYRSSRAAVELEAAKFEEYLRERGLDGVLEQRARSSGVERERAVREVYSRCAKALVRVGGAAEGHDRRLDFTLELVAEEDLFALARTGGTEDGAELGRLPLRLFYEGAPLAHALVSAVRLDRPAALPPASAGETLAARTDAEGRVAMQLPSAGRWLFAAVHMVPASGVPGADWESFWASLAVEIE